MAGPITTTQHFTAIPMSTPSPSGSVAQPNRPPLPPASAMPALAASVKPAPLADRSHSWRVKLFPLNTHDGAVSPAASKAITEWIKRRPALDSCIQLPLEAGEGTGVGARMGGMMYRYQYRAAEPSAARCEAFYTGVPGLLLAALPVHPEAERRAGANPLVTAVAQQVAEPPVGMLTGIWQNTAQDTFHLHNNTMHKMGADGVWVPHPIPGDAVPGAHIRMLGQQADGHVYAEVAGKIFRLPADGSGHIGTAPEGAVVRVDKQGAAHTLLDGCLARDGGAGRRIALLRDDGAGGSEPSPARVKDFAIDGNAGLVMLDHKGRLYQATNADTAADTASKADAGTSTSTSNGAGALCARRLELPLPGGNEDWAVTSLGQSADGSMQAIAQHREGQRVTLQRVPGATGFEPVFTLDHATLLVTRQGLHAPEDANLASRVQLDGHAELALHQGLAFFRENSQMPWAALNGADGKPLQHVQTIMASPFGFIDRKPAFALQHAPATQSWSVVHLNLQGRTTFLPADRGQGSTPAGGPLAVVPSQVSALPTVLVEHDQEIGEIAVCKQRQVFFLEKSADSKRILASTPAQPGQAAALHDLNADGALNPISLALPLDNHLTVLHRHADQTVSLRRLDDAGAWQEVALDVAGLAANARLQQLRTSRTGQLEVSIVSPQSPQGSWHAVLPQMTVRDESGVKTLAPARLLPLPVLLAVPPAAQETPVADSLNAGSNDRVNRQQASRIRVGNAVASVRTTLAGNQSTDPITLQSQVTGLVHTTGDHTRKVLVSMVGTVRDSARAFANSLGFTAMPDAQFERLKLHFHRAQLAHARLQESLVDDGNGMALAVAFRQAFALPHGASAGPEGATRASVALESLLLAEQAHADGTGARIEMLESMLFDLRKVGIKDRALDPDLVRKPDLRSGANASYQAADLWRTGTRMLGEVLGGESNVLPGIMAAFDQLPDDAALAGMTSLDERERGLLVRLRSLLHDLAAGGVRLPGAPQPGPDDDPGQARRDLRDPHAIRSANIARALLQYQQLLTASGPAALRELQAAQQESIDAGLGRLAKLGVSTWNDLEALDDIVATFRAGMADPSSARRQQLLKIMEMPADAPRDEMAARMTAVLQDLYNRSTLFSTASDNKSVTASLLSHRMQVLGYGDAAGVAGEHIHALGVERIGDSLEGDAGLVAFFVRHNKASMTATGSKGIDINPSREGAQEEATVSPFRTQLNKVAEGIASFSLSAAGRMTLGAAMQHGVGAAVILSPESIPEFARLLFDSVQDDATGLLSIGVNRGAIGLDLFETNLDLRGAITVGANFSARPKQSFGAPVPTDPANPGAAPGPDSRRAVWSANAGAGITVDVGVLWNEMELHLDHTWKNILGLEYQGRLATNTSLDAGLNLGSTFSIAIGKMFGDLDAVILPNMSNIRLAGINLGVGNGNFFGLLNPMLNGLKEVGNRLTDSEGNLALAPATYKRTLDVEVTEPVSEGQWHGAIARLARVFPQAEQLELPALVGDRFERIDQWLAGIQGQHALDLERKAVPGDNSWQAEAHESTATAVQSGQAWRPRSVAERTEVINELKLLRQQDSTALQHQAMLIPGARIEINTFGTGALDQMVTQAVGHWHLGSKMKDVQDAKQQIPGLGDVLKRIKNNSENITQVRFVFEMRPHALRRLNDAMALHSKQMAADKGGPPLTGAEQNRLRMSWRDVMFMARSSPDLYRLAVIVPHNTDDNPSTVNVGLAGFNHGRTASTSHQLFQSEFQLQYDTEDRLLGVQVLEGAARALSQDFDAMRREGVKPLTIPQQTLSEEHFGLASPVGRPIG